MATLESLKGSDKLREAYPKINRNFDEINQEALNLSQRLNTIITTPIDGEAAAQELVDARTSITKGKTFDTLGARLEEIEQEGGSAEKTAYDNAESELEAENVQDAIDETVGMVKSHLAETVPHAELAVRTITVGVGKDFTTIQGAINSLKKRIDAIITINVDAGTYAENVELFGFYGSGTLTINGGSDLETAANYVVNGFYVSKCNGISVNIRGFEGIGNTTVFRGSGSTFVDFRYCRTESLSEYGFMFNFGCNGLVNGCLASNKSEAALRVDSGSTVFSAFWTAGSGNTRGIWCRGASTVGKYGTQPQGATAEVADQGGAIR